MNLSPDVYTAIRRNAYRMDQDWEDRVQDAAVWLLEHEGTKTTTDDDGNEIVSAIEPDHAIALGTLHMRGRIRNARKRGIQQSLTDPITFATAERATATKPEQTDARAMLAERLSGLTLIQQRMARYMLAGLTQREIAAKMGVSVKAIEKRLAKMRDVNR